MNRHCLWVLWGRLVSFSCTTVLLLCAISILLEIDAWRAYETGLEILHEVGARLLLAVSCATLMGTAATALTLPFVLADRTSMQGRCERIAHTASLLTAICSTSALIGLLVRWSVATGLLSITNRASVVLWLGLSGLAVIGYLLHPFSSRREARATSRFVTTFSGRTTRRFVLVSGIFGLLTAFRGTTPGVSRPPRRAASRPAESNLILVTFDALSAQDMSCYGYPLATTPNIDALARKSYLFTKYYATSTFTTPNVVSMLSGRYPSSTRVYHYGARLHGIDTERTLPRELRRLGFRTLASVANPGAHPDYLGFGSDFDELPPAPIMDLVTRETAAAFKSAQLAYDAGLAARLVPYTLEQMSPRLFGRRCSSTPPALSFQQARALLSSVEQPYFLWIHTYAPHFPYLPDPPYLHKFLPGDELRTHAEFANMVDLKGYSYSPARQPIVDKARLRYNEWIAQADGAFGQFMAMLTEAGHLRNTAVIVSADHGESFAGGYVGHGGPEQRRPILHVPLIIHLPGQRRGAIDTRVADQTALAPTILQLAGGATPEWMEGRPLLSSEGGKPTEAAEQPSAAFAQFLEPNSVFAPVRRGTLGVIDGRSQYVLTLDSGAGALYDLADSDRQDHDRSHAEPEQVARLHGEIARKFPSLIGERA